MVEKLGFPGRKGIAVVRPPEQTLNGGHREGSASERGYTGAWRRARAGFLAKHPLCEVALLDGRTYVADTVDHLYPHCGIKALFWRRDWWVACEGRWHSRDKQRIERMGEDEIDALALRLGRPLLRVKDPELYRPWREAFEARRS